MPHHYDYIKAITSPKKKNSFQTFLFNRKNNLLFSPNVRVLGKMCYGCGHVWGNIRKGLSSSNANLLLHLILIANYPLPSSSVFTHFSPCPNSCSGNGECTTPWGVCSCFTGYTGSDCSVRMCPAGPAWSDVATATDDAHNIVECSNRGKCDVVTGTCICETMFEGSACERRSCPNDCSGRGRCLSSKALARMQDPGLLRRELGCTSDDICASDPSCSNREYSACFALNVYETPWDADRFYGCYCDEGYSGYDCSVRTCPMGDDPLTTSQLNDVQLLECYADFGTFTLSFGRETTVPISVDASVADVTKAINALTSLRGQQPKVSVSPISSLVLLVVVVLSSY